MKFKETVFYASKFLILVFPLASHTNNMGNTLITVEHSVEIQQKIIYCVLIDGTSYTIC